MKQQKKIIFKLKILLVLTFIRAEQLSSLPEPDESSVTIHMNLSQAENYAITNSFDVKIQSLKERILIEGKTESWRAFLPQGSVNYSNNVSVNRRAPDSRNNEISVNIKQPVYDGGKTALQNQLSELNIIQNKQEFQLLKNNIILKVRTSFFKIIQANANLNILLKSLERTRVQLNQSEKESKLGLATKLDLLEIQARLKEIEGDYKKNQRDYESLLLEFTDLLNLPKETVLDIVTPPLEEIPIFENSRPFRELLSIAYEKRPEIYKNRVNLIKSEVEYNIANTFYIPKISLTSGFTLSGEEFPPKNKGWNIGIVIDANLFGSTASDNGQGSSTSNGAGKGYNNSTSLNILNDIGYEKRRLESLVALETSRNEVNQLKDNIYIEIKKSFDAVTHNFVIQKTAWERKELVRERLQIETRKAELGELKRVDLMDTEMEYLKAEQSFTSAKVEYMISANQLEIAIGVNPDFLHLAEYQ